MADEPTTTHAGVPDQGVAAVAYELMNRIARRESASEAVKAEQGDREYWFTLYAQCHRACRGESVERILRDGE